MSVHSVDVCGNPVSLSSVLFVHTTPVVQERCKATARALGCRCTAVVVIVVITRADAAWEQERVNGDAAARLEARVEPRGCGDRDAPAVCGTDLGRTAAAPGARDEDRGRAAAERGTHVRTEALGSRGPDGTAAHTEA